VVARKKQRPTCSESDYFKLAFLVLRFVSQRLRLSKGFSRQAQQMCNPAQGWPQPRDVTRAYVETLREAQLLTMEPAAAPHFQAFCVAEAQGAT
jgi:hypothetical protein